MQFWFKYKDKFVFKTTIDSSVAIETGFVIDQSQSVLSYPPIFLIFLKEIYLLM